MDISRRIRWIGPPLVAVAVVAAPDGALGAVWSPGGDAASIQEAIDAAASGDVVLIAPGIYPGSLSFSGKSLTVAGRCEAGEACATVAGTVSCDGGGSLSVYRLFVKGDDVGVDASGCSVVLTEAIVRGDTALRVQGDGDESVVINDSVVGGFEAGTVVERAALLSVSDSALSSDGTYALDAVEVAEVGLHGSRVTSAGPPIRVSSADTAEVTGSTLLSMDDSGGDVQAGEVRVRDTRWYAEGEGPSLAAGDAPGAVVLRSRFESHSGSALRLSSGVYEVLNCEFTGATIGVAAYYGEVSMSNSATAGSTEGVVAYAGAEVTVYNHLFADHTAGADARYGSVTVRYSNFDGVDYDTYGDVEGGDWYHFDPMLVEGTWRLAEGSPAIDAGSPHPTYRDRDGSRNDLGPQGGPYASP